ncbi:MAG: 50S ribosomal protein L19e [Candidatus Methanolliviera hydrocarbonicum]|jgi:LSU ribosomal protein L19E|uniref:Large ribosomal subunit protein eL19 n=1 Tax=Candidatus Methanolliviera hydrocarbonicum TaxID=2491085 RepID=A0A520KYJ9_9EURY|nr:MAG: 50S ribosomal protein L19e [Candidatus Methanolliviera hydrocarbonicum]
MTDLSMQKNLAAKVMKIGKNRVRLDPEKGEDIAVAITRDDIRGLIEDGAIKKVQKKGVSRGRARERDAKRTYGHRKGHGKRKGAKNARSSRKERWMKTVRAQRRYLRRLRDGEEIDRSDYRMLYNKSKGGEFRSVRLLDTYIKMNNIRR